MNTSIISAIYPQPVGRKVGAKRAPRPTVIATSLTLAITLLTAPAAQATISHLNTFGGPGTADGRFSFEIAMSGIIGMAIAPNGNVYISDPGGRVDDPSLGNRIQVFDHEGGFLFKWGSFGVGDGQFLAPAGVAVNSVGQVYVADQFNHRIQKFDAGGGHIKNFDGTATGGPGFAIPTGVAIGKDDQIYVMDATEYDTSVFPAEIVEEADRVHRFNSSEQFQNVWGGLTTATTVEDLEDGEFRRGQGVAADTIDGRVFTSDTVFPAERVQAFTEAGDFIDKLNAIGSGDGQFDRPFGLAVNTLGDLYVTDILAHNVQKFNGALGFIQKFETSGTAGGDLQFPTAVAVAPTGELYIAEFISGNIKRFFDSEAWTAGTNTFDNAATGATELLGPGQILTAAKTLIVNDTTTVNPTGSLTVDGGTFKTDTLDLTAGGTFAMLGGRLVARIIDGDLTITGGTVAPGGSPGITTVNGNYTQLAGGTLEIEINEPATTPGVHFDQLIVSGTATLNGTLDVNAQPVFDPAIGDTIEVMRFAGHTNTFDMAEGMLIDTGRALAPIFGSTDLTLRVSLPGDVDLNDAVNVADLAVFALNFGTAPGVGSWDLGDFNGDGIVSVADLSLLALNFGTDLALGLPASALTVDQAAALVGIDLSMVPEPCTLLVFGTALGANALGRRRRPARVA